MKDMNWPERVAYLENQLADSDRDNQRLREFIEGLPDGDEIERLRSALKKVGDDYPGSSCQQWCYEQAGIPLSAFPTVPHWYCAECRGQAITSDGPIIHVATCSRR